MLYDITCTCTFGLESVLKREITALGYEISEVSDGAVSLKGKALDIARLNMCLRCSNRVLITLGKYPAASFDELFDSTQKLEWGNILPINAKFNVSKISCVKSNIMSKSDSQRIIKKAIVDRLKYKYKVKNLNEDGSEYNIFIKIKKDEALFQLNTSGESLHRRGYRLNKTEAPIKETLAAGIIMLSGFRGSQPFADIMCGSGTFITEAAMIAANIAPGLKRNFAFEKWGFISSASIESLREELKHEAIQPEIRLLGSDIDERALKAAKANAVNAGVENMTAFQKLDFREFRSRKKHGILMINPPYGERIGKGETDNLYSGLRDVYEALEDWRMYILCGNEEFERFYGKKADRNRKLYNGNMLTYLYQYF